MESRRESYSICFIFGGERSGRMREDAKDGPKLGLMTKTSTQADCKTKQERVNTQKKGCACGKMGVNRGKNGRKFGSGRVSRPGKECGGPIELDTI